VCLCKYVFVFVFVCVCACVCVCVCACVCVCRLLGMRSPPSSTICCSTRSVCLCKCVCVFEFVCVCVCVCVRFWYVVPSEGFLKLKCPVRVPVRAQQNGHGIVQAADDK